jgi:hypothetical protein
VEDRNAWALILERLQNDLGAEDYRRWFLGTGYASDSGDQVAVWVPSYAHRAHILLHFHETIALAAAGVGRPGLQIRFLVTGYDEDEELG